MVRQQRPNLDAAYLTIQVAAERPGCGWPDALKRSGGLNSRNDDAGARLE